MLKGVSLFRVKWGGDLNRAEWALNLWKGELHVKRRKEMGKIWENLKYV